ncbi:RING/Ubox like zinc-binding domain-containing protein [Blastocladiella britannica]|nr:RING/Ubox like zinc-binding domain-containing protein [Blastocladiella britannica]
MDAADIDDLVCPLCCEEIAASDKFFYPCPCGYQVCRFCWNNIRENHNRLCPACRREYDDESVQFTAAPQEEIARIISERKRRKAGNKRSGTATASSSFVDSGGAAADRSHLKDIKVTQRTLVYVTNLPPKYAVEETLASDPYFGQFGKIVKLSISRRPPIVGKDGRTGENQIGVHVTFARPDDAYRCIQFVDGATIESRTLHATYGQTKYCAVWLQHRPCATHNCMFLHEIVDGDAASPPPAVFVLHFFFFSLSSFLG